MAGVNLLALRSHNGAVVLDLLRRAGAAGISRLELADRTGLTPQAVSKITARLRADGLVTEAGYRASTGGKPRTVLRLVPDAGHAVGLHLDRDELRAVLCDLTGAVVARRQAPLDLGAGADNVVEGAAREVEALLAAASEGPGGASAGYRGGTGGGAVPRPGYGAGYGSESFESGGGAGGGGSGGAGPDATSAADAASAPEPHRPPLLPVLGVGVALPGPLDHLHGVLHRVTGFPEWDGFPLRAALARRLGVPVVVDKDTNAAALGLAATAGAHGSFAYLHLGTGLGAGLVINGAVHRGARTRAGEFGHQVVQLDGPLCECGNRGCVEALCLAAVARGDVEEAARVLGTAVANLVGLLDIELVLLGGRTIEARPEVFVRGVGFVLDEWARLQGEDPAVPVRIAGGGASGVAEGAAQLLLAPLFGREDG
ncbi:ROK family transcriptional regulator [Streptomyces sp. DSM 3412]|uniref:ROK family transcriptional regulator n=1 Tax=Streptomyces gottesmaniae TaxID=3075518 RepID=A0ABU2Z8C5_9ACTN|nr:ROK family transcriptional regulator [Streptomyces sp. DSM 3412]MDT0572840.1 ROK family transcriptional regulator [Streptomyces sp. DSM 3412]